MVAVMASPIIKREKVFCRLKAIRFAINEETFKLCKFGIL